MLAVLFAVADNTEDATVVIVDDETPPTLFTVGKSALPVKSPANLMIPLSTLSASVALIEMPLRGLFQLPAVVASIDIPLP